MIRWKTLGARVPPVHAVDVFVYLLTGYCQTERPSVERKGFARVKQSCVLYFFATILAAQTSGEQFLVSTLLAIV